MNTRDIIAAGTAVVILVALFVAHLFGNVGLGNLSEQNVRVFIAINSLAQFPLIQAGAGAITHLGDITVVGFGIIFISVLSIWIRPWRVWAVGLVISLLIIGVLGFGLKRVYDVKRPLQSANDFSLYYSGREGWYYGPVPVPTELVKSDHQNRGFPSGHALAVFAVAGVLWRARRARWWAVLIAALVALSRIIIGVHFPADVLAGAGLGFLVGFLVMDGWWGVKRPDL